MGIFGVEQQQQQHVIRGRRRMRRTRAAASGGARVLHDEAPVQGGVGGEIGSGAYGAAIAYTETLAEGGGVGEGGSGNGDVGQRIPPQSTRKAIVKVAFDADSDASSANEAAHLAAVRGAEHIVRLLYEGPTAAHAPSRRTLVEDLEEHGD
ncbi:hypothetical protein DL765_006885 [Monosporascus sp. GIB2]|nr:hypothetical protein DL765_006885 [Monosporascus sp. GIB2]